MDLFDIIVYFAVAAIGGAINSVAGGGTFLTFPILILNGLSPLSANVMSTVALWPGSVASAYAYRKELNVGRKQLKEFITVSVIGSSIGTALLLLLPEIMFAHTVPWLLLFATLIFMFGGSAAQPMPDAGNQLPKKAPASDIRHLTSGAAMPLQFAIAIYGGYFGAGIGILMLAMLQLLGFSNIHRMNALKVILGSAINAVAVLIFVLAGKVVWPIAVIMILGGVTGGMLGTRLALKTNPRHVRRLVTIVGAVMTGYFFLQ